MRNPCGIFQGCLILVCLISSSLTAGDWPQILGPGRNGIASQESLATTWPEEGPKVLWQYEVGDGFAGVSVGDGVAVLYHRPDENDECIAFAAKTGKVLWKQQYPSRYRSSFSSDHGPRCVPVIHQKRVYLYSAEGVLRCVDLATGKMVWQQDTHKKYTAQEGYFGAGSTPIIEGDRIIVNVGGDKDDAGIVAFSLKDGTELWKAVTDKASYSSPVAITLDGVRHLIVIGRLKCVSLDPNTGKTRFEFPFGKRGPTVNGSSPTLINGNHLFVTASYGIGAVYAKISADGVKLVWESDEILSSQYASCIEHKGHLFGIHGRDDIPPSDLKCIDPATQKTIWEQTGFGYATLIKADDKLIILKTNGELILADADVTKYRELARSQVFQSTTRALPALSNGLLYARDEHVLKCLDLSR